MTRAQVLRDATALAIAQMVANAAAFAISWGIARAYGQVSYGMFAAAYAGAQAIGAFADAGVRMALIRETAHTPEAWRGLLLRAWLSASAMGLMALIGAAVIVFWREGWEGQQLRAYLAAHVLCWSLMRITLGVAAGKGMLRAVAAWMAAERLIIAGFVVPAGWLVHPALETMAKAMAGFEAMVLVAIVAWTWRLPAGKSPAMSLVAFLRRALPFGIGGALQGLLGRMDLIVLGFSAHPAQTGRYAAGQLLAGMMLLMANALAGAAFPRFSSMHAAGELARAKRAAMDAARMLAGVLLFAASLLSALSPWLVSFVYGASYAEGAHWLAWFSPWMLWPALGALAGAVGSAWGFQGWWARLLLALVGPAFASFWLAAKIGVGSVAIAYGLLNWVLVAGYWHKLAGAGLLERGWFWRASLAGWGLWGWVALVPVPWQATAPVVALALIIGLKLADRHAIRMALRAGLRR